MSIFAMAVEAVESKRQAERQAERERCADLRQAAEAKRKHFWERARRQSDERVAERVAAERRVTAERRGVTRFAVYTSAKGRTGRYVVRRFGISPRTGVRRVELAFHAGHGAKTFWVDASKVSLV